jgi:hypothetical protein
VTQWTQRTQLILNGPLPTPKRQRRSVLGPVVGLVLLAVCALIVLGIVRSSIGTAGVLVGHPVRAAARRARRRDVPVDRPLGARTAPAAARRVPVGRGLLRPDRAHHQLLGRRGDRRVTGAGDVLGAVLVAPVVEEAVKGAFLVGLLLFRFREFDGVVDGIVYAGLVAAGFAFTENILYLGSAFAEEQMAGQSGGVLGVLLLRGLLSPFAHPLFTAMTGIGAGIAARSGSIGVRVVAVAVGYLVAVGLHAVWNGSAVLLGGTAFLGVYVVVMAAAVPGHDRRGGVAAPPRAAHGGRAAARVRPPRLDRAERGAAAGQPGRAARWQAAVRRRSGRQVADAVAALPGGGHRTGVPARAASRAGPSGTRRGSGTTRRCTD